MNTLAKRVPARHDVSLTLVAEAALPSRFGTFRIASFENASDGKDHVAIIKGDVRSQSRVLCRIHSECLTGDALGSLRCDCRDQLEHALRRLEDEGEGIVLYMRQEGRGIGLANKIRAYELQDSGLDTVEANLALGFRDDERDYAICASMLELLGVQSVRLMTNNPRKVNQLSEYGIEVEERVAHQLPSNPHNVHYLETKAARSGHLLRFGDRLQLVSDG
jgi:GTP cyclohydrolase II